MTTIVGIFDDTGDMDRVAERLADSGIDASIYDDTLVTEEPGSIDPAVPTLAPGAVPTVVLGAEEPNLLSARDRDTVVRAFKRRLSDYDLSDEEIDAYATTFLHKGKFVLVKADADQAEQVMKILKDSRATRVNRHD
jgi:hypothetical protein